MYLDPGSAGMAVQAFFGLIAALIVGLSSPRETLARWWKNLRK
jgi:hypothetical protein